jgi:hypothetical protein
MNARLSEPMTPRSKITNLGSLNNNAWKTAIKDLRLDKRSLLNDAAQKTFTQYPNEKPETDSDGILWQELLLFIPSCPGNTHAAFHGNRVRCLLSPVLVRALPPMVCFSGVACLHREINPGHHCTAYHRHAVPMASQRRHAARLRSAPAASVTRTFHQACCGLQCAPPATGWRSQHPSGKL